MAIRWFHPDADEELDAPSEWAHAWGALEDAPPQLGSLRVSSGGERLPISRRWVGGAERVGFRWPRRDPGGHVVYIESPGRSASEPVHVAARKLSDAARAAMLEQLSLGLPAEIAWSLQDVGSLGGVVRVPRRAVTIAGEVERLRRATLEGAGRLSMGEAARRIASAPHDALAADTRWTDMERARLPVPARLLDAWRRPGGLDANHLPRALVEHCPRRSLDTYENRVATTWLAHADAACRWLSPLCKGGELDDVQRELRVARAALHPLGHVPLLPMAPARVTMVLVRRPEYRAALEGLRELAHSSVARLEDVALAAPLDNVPALYQRWGTLRVLMATLRAAAARGWRVHPPRFFTSLLGAAVLRLLPDGRAALTLERADGASVNVIPERSYGDSGALRSLTYEQRPDVAIERWSPSGGHAVWLFDPKYKLAADDEGSAKPVKADVDKMHAYRDAIRDERGRHVVRYAALLYPGETRRWGNELAALRAHPEHAAVLDAELDTVLERVLHDDD